MILRVSEARKIIVAWMQFRRYTLVDQLKEIDCDEYKLRLFSRSQVFTYEQETANDHIIELFTEFYNGLIIKNPLVTFETILNDFVARGTIEGGEYLTLDYECVPPKVWGLPFSKGISLPLQLVKTV